MPQITLAEIAAATEKKFGDFEVVIDTGETLVFHNPMRLAKEKRRALANVFDLEAQIEIDPDADKWDLYKQTFKVIARSEAEYEKLAAAVGDVPATWEGLFKEFENQTEAEKA